MTNNVVEDVLGEEIDNVHTASDSPQQDALSMISQAVDSMIAASRIIEDNLSKIEPENVQEKAAKDGIKDIIDTAIKPYLADIVVAMNSLGD